MCILIFYINLSQTFLILIRIQRDIIINVPRSSSKFIRYSSQILIEFSRQIFENRPTSNFTNKKYVPWEPSCSMRADRQRDRHNEPNSRFS